MLYEDFMTRCTKLTEKRTPDGEGGQITTWTDDGTFLAAIVLESASEVRRAEQMGFHGAYTVTTPAAVLLPYHTVFRRESDGQIFRVTGNGADKVSPSRATFAISIVSAERWELT